MDFPTAAAESSLDWNTTTSTSTSSISSFIISSSHRFLKHHDYDYYYPHEGNSTLSTSVTIHVTPEHYYLISWGILWACFVLAILFGAYQTRKDYQWMHEAQKNNNNSNTDDLEQQTVGKKSGGGRIVLVGGTRVSMNVGSAANAPTAGNGGSDREAVSSGDTSRTMFRRLLLVAMICRAIAIPVQIYSDPLWVQLIADTLPVMAFASAWTMLVSFFVQLVGVALGTGTSTTPGTVIQITAYCVYLMLIVTILFDHNEAAVLLYSLLCCIYAALLGTSLYFCPRLLTLLYPSLMLWKRQQSPPTEAQSQSPPPPSYSRNAVSTSSSPPTSSSSPKAPPALAIRLAICSGVCLFVFAARTINFANKIVSPAHTASWWWQYGALELIPSVLFLIIIKHPKAAATSTSGGGNETTNDNASGGRMNRASRSFQRTDSYGSGSRPTATNKSVAETTPLIRSSGGYGSSGGGVVRLGGSDSASSLKDHGIGTARNR